MIPILLVVTATFRPPAPTVGDLITINFQQRVTLNKSPQYEIVSQRGSKVVIRTFEPRPFPIVAETEPPRARPVAEAYLDRVLVASVRERIAAARDGGPTFAVVLGQVDVDGVGETTRRAMVHRAIRATLGATATLLGGDVSAYRYGESGVAAIAPAGRDPAREERLCTLVRARLDELMRTMTSTVRAFGAARWNVRAGAATWSEEVATTTALLRQAEAALAADGERRDAA